MIQYITRKEVEIVNLNPPALAGCVDALRTEGGRRGAEIKGASIRAGAVGFLSCLLVTLLAAVGARAGAGQHASARKGSVPSLPGYKLIWSDEFNHKGLPDPAKWNYEEGFVRNQELQYYTRARKENARVENGMLVIEGTKERFKNPRFDPTHGTGGSGQSRDYADYTSASLTSRTSWQYGRIEVRAKLPHGKGVWPAIWTLGDNIKQVGWPGCGEIDIMEFVGHTPNQIHATVHYGKGGKHESAHQALTVDRPWEDFHVYAVEWTPERMDFYFDQTKYHSFDLKAADDGGYNAFHKPQYLLINLALGGAWGGPIDDSILPQKYLIDYVRVYQKEG